jgi:lysozyme
MPNLTDFFATLKPQTTRQKSGWAAAAVIAVSLVGGFEGFASHPYRDTVGTGHPETWCYGETPADGGKVPAYGTLFTKAECTASLQRKLTTVYDPMVRQCIDAKALDGYPYREAALVSFIYNGGQGWLCKPHRHTYTAVARNINSGNYSAGCHAMLAYDRANGRVLSGLARRRRLEAALCLKGK